MDYLVFIPESNPMVPNFEPYAKPFEPGFAFKPKF